MIKTWRNTKTVASIIGAAEVAASESGSERVGLEHLVMGALSLPDDSARVLLAAHGRQPHQFADAIENADKHALAGLGITTARPSRRIVPRPTGPDTRFEAPASAALHRTQALARSSANGRLRAAHVLMAAAAEPSGATARAFALMTLNTELLATGESP